MSIFNFFRKKSEPIVIKNELGTFIMQNPKKYRFYSGCIKWLDNDVDVSLHCDGVDSLTADTALENLRKIVADADEWDKKIRKYIADDMSDKDGLIETWSDDTKITKEVFLNRISIGFMHIYPNDEIYFDYDMDGMFTEHSVGIWTDISGNISWCELWG